LWGGVRHLLHNHFPNGEILSPVNGRQFFISRFAFTSWANRGVRARFEAYRTGRDFFSVFSGGHNPGG